jgi:hypothetical protein
VQDRDGAMAAQPMQVDWTAVTTEQDRQQPVNRALLLEVARMLAERGHTQALAENRRRRFEISSQLLREAAEQIEHLGADDEAVKAIAALLVDEDVVFRSPMLAREMKMRHMASYAAPYSRDAEGKSRKRSK